MSICIEVIMEINGPEVKTNRLDKGQNGIKIINQPQLAKRKDHIFLAIKQLRASFYSRNMLCVISVFLRVVQSHSAPWWLPCTLW